MKARMKVLLIKLFSPCPPENMNLTLTTCVFCQKESKKKKLSQVLPLNSENKIKLIAKNNKTKRVGSNDLNAMEVKYHPNCFTPQWKKYCHTLHVGSTTALSSKDEALHCLLEELNKGLKKGKGYSAITIFNRYVCLNGTKARKRLIQLVTDHFGNEVEFIEA